MIGTPTPRQLAGLLASRPRPPRMCSALGAGRHTLRLADRSAVVFVPEVERPTGRPLLIVLHGASNIDGGLIDAAIDRARIGDALVMAPVAAGSSWDMLRGGYGPDVAFIDALLAWAFARYAVDAKRVGIGGFSDGGSYALSLGLMNGDLFSRILAFSPGFIVHGRAVGRPRIFISHGRSDHVLPIERCGRKLAGELKGARYDVDYREFDGGHVVPAAVADAGMRRFLNR